MSSEKKNEWKVKLKLLFSFSLLIFIFLVFVAYTLYGIHKLSTLTLTIYNHPLVVSNAAIQSNVSITKMHRNMKDVVLFESEDLVQRAIADVEQEKRKVYLHLDTVRDRIIGKGGQDLEHKARELFEGWSPIRDEVIDLIRSGQRKKAAEITVTTGADHVARLETIMMELTTYARNKADIFLAEAQQTQARVNFTIIVFFMSGIIVSALTAFFTIRQIALDQKELLKSKKRLIAAQRIAQMGDFTWHVETGEISWSEALFSLLGYDHRETIDYPYVNKQIHHPEDLHRVTQWLRDSIASGTGELPINEYRLLRKDGSTIHVSVQGKIQIENGETTVFATVQNISDRIDTEEQLKKAKRLLDDTGHITRTGGWELDPETSEVSWTEETYRIHELPLGHKPALDEVINFYHPDDREELNQAIQNALNDGTNYDLELRFTSALGNNLWIRITCQTEVKDGRFVKLKGTFQDVTELHHAKEEARRMHQELEKRVRERTRQLEAVNTELKSFAYSVSHDLRAPLRAISGFAEIISRRHKENLNEQGQHYLDNIIEASTLMGELIDDLLTYSRLGRKALYVKPVELSDILIKIRKNFEEKIFRTGAQINIPEYLPPIESDSTMIYVILSNIIENSLTYTDHDIEPVINVSVHQSNSGTIITLQDNGIGIAQEHHDKIFNIFQRLHPQSRYPGTGIGLGLVKKAVTILGGTVSLESTPGKGSTFRIELPRRTK